MTLRAIAIAIVVAACSAEMSDVPTDCGDVVCAETEVCVIRTPIGPGQSYACEAAPSSCATDRTCACLAATMCTGTFDVCSDGDVANTITCECMQCR